MEAPCALLAHPKTSLPGSSVPVTHITTGTPIDPFSSDVLRRVILVMDNPPRALRRGNMETPHASSHDAGRSVDALFLPVCRRRSRRPYARAAKRIAIDVFVRRSWIRLVRSHHRVAGIRRDAC